VSSSPLFSNGMKFVILDEVDYMTKNAQQALKYLLEEYPKNVRFCLICNYISKIDEGLQNEFLKLRFDQLPSTEVVTFLKKISDEEELNIDTNILLSIQRIYKSDLRSMVNYIQTNQDMFKEGYTIIDHHTWDELYTIVSNKPEMTNPDIIQHIRRLTIRYNMDTKNIIVDFLNYIIRKHEKACTNIFLSFVENIVHSNKMKEYSVDYLLDNLRNLLSST
jgi:DNA polymerase III delta prime subunit